MTKVFDPKLLTAGELKTSLSKLAGYNHLYSFSVAPDLLLREVSSVQEAINCGGVFIGQMSTDATPVLRWQFVAGEVMRAALSRAGHNGLYDRETMAYKRRIRWPNKPFGNGSSGTRYGAVDILPVQPSTFESRLDPTREHIILGLITRGHGRGFGPTAVTGASAPTYNEVVDIASSVTLANNEHLDDWRSLDVTSARHQYCLSAKVTVAPSIRNFLLQNKAHIIGRWKELGAPSGAVMTVYEESFEEAVKFAFDAQTPLVIYFPFVGVGATTATLNGVSGLGYTLNESTRSAVQIVGKVTHAETPEEVLERRMHVWHKYGIGAKGAGIDVVGSDGLTPISGLPGAIRVGNAEFSVRELLGACLPKAGLDFRAQPGAFVADTVIQKLLAKRKPDAHFAGSAEPTMAQVEAAEGTFSSSVTNQLTDTAGYLGPYLGQMVYLGQVWDQVAKERAKS